MSQHRVTQALISVSEKDGVLAFARELHLLGVRLLSTGGTAKLLSQAGLPVTEVSQHTGFPEMLDGRVKTLHPTIHGGLLARRDRPEHLQAIADHDISAIDLLVVNLYPFAQTVAKPDCSFEDAIENIDIGGPAMLRAAAKNYHGVAVVIDPADYQPVLDDLRRTGGVASALRFELARKAFAHTAQYDGAVANYLGRLDAQAPHSGAHDAYPVTFNQQWQRVQNLRYGENPHQSAAFYRDANPPIGSLATYTQLQGKALSYNNIADADAAWECVRGFDSAVSVCVIVKHANPCGVAIAASSVHAYAGALATDPTSAFGGIIAFNHEVDEACAQQVAKQFVEVLMAPAFSASALAVFADKKNVRLLKIELGEPVSNAYDLKRVGGGLLVQSPDSHRLIASELRVVTRRQPTALQLSDLLFAWQVAKFVKSNAIVFCGHGKTLGVGAGQMSRVDSARIASIKAHNAGLSLASSVVASDAFFPFRDGLDVVIDAGAVAVIQPGGSMRDDEVIAAANERDVTMVLTGVRHFRH
jgi:phosphoribosylaminoimidazolecarboxamide formyltransferase / IMP cyclohydrolase